MLRAALVAVSLIALPLAALANPPVAPLAPPAHGAPPPRPAYPPGTKPGMKPNPRPSGASPNNGYTNQPQVYIDGTSFVTPRPATSPQHHTNTVKTSMPQQTFHSYGTSN